MNCELDTGFVPDNATDEYDAAGRIPGRELSAIVKDPDVAIGI